MARSVPVQVGLSVGAIPLREIAGHLIRRSQQIHNALWIAEFASGVTSPQYAVLAALSLWPGIDQRRLGELASLDRSSTADIVTRLAKRRWVERVRDEADRRRNVLALTPEASTAFAHLTPAASRVQDRLVAPIAPDERLAFADALRRVARVDGETARSHHDHPAAALHLGVPGHLIRCAQQIHTALWAEEFDRELTGPQFATLYVITQSPGLNQRTLSERAALDTSTAADILHRLTRRGWVLRVADPLDRRRNLLSLSVDAQRITQDLTPRVMAVQERLVSPQ